MILFFIIYHNKVQKMLIIDINNRVKCQRGCSGYDQPCCEYEIIEIDTARHGGDGYANRLSISSPFWQYIVSLAGIIGTEFFYEFVSFFERSDSDISLLEKRISFRRVISCCCSHVKSFSIYSRSGLPKYLRLSPVESLPT